MRLAIFGNSGSGKSTVAAWLATATGCRSFDLDTAAWEPNQPALERDEAQALADVRAFCCSNENWIVEGCYTNLIQAALEYTPNLLFLNPGEDVCLANCRIRPWEPHKYASKQEQDSNLEFLFSWVSEYYTRTGALSLVAHRTCFEAYRGPKLELLSVPSAQELDSKLLKWLR